MTSKNWTYPTVTFSHSLEMEARRILYLTASLTHNWYQKHDFIILPALNPRVPTSQVIIPNLPYNSIPRYWQKVAKLKLTTPIDAPPELIQSVVTLLRDRYNTSSHDKYLVKLKDNWNNISTTFWNNLFTLFPQYIRCIRHIDIYSTQYGPSTTFSLASSTGSQITIFVRHDAGVDKILWTILASLFRAKMENAMKYTWEEIEATIDWLMSESGLNCDVKHDHPMMKNLRSVQLAKYQTDSQKYLSSLGFDHVSVWHIKNSEIYFGDIKIFNLSKNEQMLLELFLTKRNQTVSYDEIAEILWSSDEKFSLFAIAKEIERLRRRIRACGIVSPVIHSHRKLGYSLV